MQEYLQPTQKESAFSVTEITRQIKDSLEGQFKSVWVKGELSNIRKPPSGHIYASLKDSDAQIRMVMFRNAASKSSNGTGAFEWKEGAEVIILGRLSVYPPQGSYQIIATHIEAVGSGALQAQFEALKQKLKAEGLFEAAHKKTLPFLPQRIGIVTSPSGAAVKDILNVISRRFPNMTIDIYPAVVQGKEAAYEIIKSITLAEKLNRVDVLIVGRGGGSIEDLWCFNDEALARKIFACPIPIVSAVGHEIDFTICDFVADVRAPTPSAAAELVVPPIKDLLSKLNEMKQILTHHVLQRLQFEKQRLDTLFHQLEHPKEKLVAQKQKLEHLLEKLTHVLSQKIQVEHQRLERLSDALTTVFPQRILQAKQYLERLMTALSSLNPKSVLSRGYALVSHQKTGKVISRPQDAKSKDKLNIGFSEGSISVFVD
jgi:exodeoxyribonuclease VII large subunit